MTNREFIFEAVGMIDDDIIEACAPDEKGAKKYTFVQKWGVIAACLCMIALINAAFVYGIWRDGRDHGGNVTPADTGSDTQTDTDSLTLEDYVNRRYDSETGEGKTGEAYFYMSVSIYSDGTFLYTPPGISSIIFRAGTWTADGDVITLSSDQLGTIHMRMVDGNLVYIAEGSDNFTYRYLEDGEVLTRGDVCVPYTEILAYTLHCAYTHTDHVTGKAEEKYSIMDYSDRFSEATLNMYIYTSEYFMRYDVGSKAYGDAEKNKLKSIDFLGETYEVTYTESFECSYVDSVYDTIDVYRTSDGTKLRIREDGTVISFKSSMNSEELTVNGSECKRIADEYLKQLCGDEAENYAVVYQNYESAIGIYSINYRYMTDGVPTTDCINIWLTGDGRLHTFNGFDIGRYDGLRINSELVSAYEENLNRMIWYFVDSKYISPDGVTDPRICQYNGKYYLKISVESNFGGSCEESTIFFVEMLA